MLKYAECPGTKQLDPLMKFKLSKCKDVTCLSDLNLRGLKRNNQATSCRTRHVNDDALENHSDCISLNTVNQLPPLLENEELG